MHAIQILSRARQAGPSVEIIRACNDYIKETKGNFTDFQTNNHEYPLIEINSDEKKAFAIAIHLHREHEDHCRSPFHYSLRRIAQLCTEQDGLTRATAYMSYACSTGEMSTQQLKGTGLSFEIVEAVQLLTRNKDESHIDHTNRIRSSPTLAMSRAIALDVRLAMLNDLLEFQGRYVGNRKRMAYKNERRAVRHAINNFA